MRYDRRTGFSLIELLVVAAILSILAAFLCPALLAAREKGRQAGCASNLKQISTAFLLYNDSWDDSFPAYHRVLLQRPMYGCAFACHWSPQLAPFIKPMLAATAGRMGRGVTVFLCPSDDQTASGSYAMNRNLGYRLIPGAAGLPNKANSEPVCDGDVKDLARTLLVYDTPVPADQAGTPDWWGDHWSDWKGAYPGDLSEDLSSTADGTQAGDPAMRPRHSRGNMVSFADGHMRWVRDIRAVVTAGGLPGESEDGEDQALSGDDGFRLR